jgi:hypothetical protein
MNAMTDDELFDPRNPLPFKSTLESLASDCEPSENIYHDVICILNNKLSPLNILEIYSRASQIKSGSFDVLAFTLKDFIRRHIDRLLLKPEWRDGIICNATDQREYLSNLMFGFHHANICRNASGKLYTEDEVRPIINYCRYLSSALCHGDYEAVSHILRFKYKDSVINNKYDLYYLAIENNFEIHENIYKKDIIGSDSQDYLTSLKWRRGNALLYLLDTDYREDLIKLHGDLFFEEMFSKDYGVTGGIPQLLISKLVASGADWYAGLMYNIQRPIMRMSIASRKRDPLNELNELFRHKSKNLELAKAIFIAQPLDIKIALCKEKGRAADLLKLTEDPELLPYVSPAKRRAFLGSELGI